MLYIINSTMFFTAHVLIISHYLDVASHWKMVRAEKFVLKGISSKELARLTSITGVVMNIPNELLV